MRIAVVCTSCSLVGTRRTGAWLSEISHAWATFARAGRSVEFLSVAGGVVPLDGIDFADADNRSLLSTDRLAATVPVAWHRASEYEAVYFAGGHGAMGDFPALYDWASKATILGAVCHGVAVLAGGPKLCSAVSCFTDDEEAEVGAVADMPFSLESQLRGNGYDIRKALPWQPSVVVSPNGRIITGQNPASARIVAEQLVHHLSKEPKV